MIHLHHPGLLSSINESKRVTDFSLTLMQMPVTFASFSAWNYNFFGERSNEKEVKDWLLKCDWNMKRSYKLIKDFPRIIMITKKKKNKKKKNTRDIFFGVQSASIFLNDTTKTKVSNLAIFFSSHLFRLFGSINHFKCSYSNRERNRNEDERKQKKNYNKIEKGKQSIKPKHENRLGMMMTMTMHQKGETENSLRVRISFGPFSCCCPIIIPKKKTHKNHKRNEKK